MYCSACNLEYSDQLNFCKQCGRSLVAEPKSTISSRQCCTRCGARLISGESFCQQCGARTTAKAEDVIVGACLNCRTPWSSAWLYCSGCGLDRDRALELVVDRAPHCPHCSAEAVPYTQFCEVCGHSLTLSEMETIASISSATAVKDGDEIGNTLAFPIASTHSTRNAAASEEIAESLDARPATTLLDKLSSESVGSEIGSASEVVSERSRTTSFEPARATLQSSRAVLTKNVEEGGKRGRKAAAFEAIDEIENASTIAIRQSSNPRIAWGTWAVVGALTILFGGLALVSFSRWSRKSEAQAVPVISSNSGAITVPADMIYVPGGTFRMGRDDGDEYERPMRTVTVEPFFIDQTEVTNEQYQKFVHATGYHAPSHWEGSRYQDGEGDLPVVNVSWKDASEYARWAGKRLPTEAEWEFAARGTEGRLYPWGSNWNPELANTRDSARNRIIAVGSFPDGASPFGALDMCGNVWEWTVNNLISYGDGRILAPGKVIRGGAYDVLSERATATYRGVVQPEKSYHKTGFRCVRSAK